MKSGLGVLALLVCVPLAAEGQALPLTAGARIRVTAPRAALEKTVATVLEQRGDSIVVDVEGIAHTLLFADLSSLEISTGRRTNVNRYATYGGVIGFFAGATIGYLRYEKCVKQGPFDCWLTPVNRGEAALLGGWIGGSAGALVGMLVGLTPRDIWSPVALPVRTMVAPSPSGGVSVRFTRSF